MCCKLILEVIPPFLYSNPLYLLKSAYPAVSKYILQKKKKTNPKVVEGVELISDTRVCNRRDDCKNIPAVILSVLGFPFCSRWNKFKCN